MQLKILKNPKLSSGLYSSEQTVFLCFCPLAVWSLTVRVSTDTTKTKYNQYQTKKTHSAKRSVVHGVKKRHYNKSKN